MWFDLMNFMYVYRVFSDFLGDIYDWLLFLIFLELYLLSDSQLLGI